MASQRLIAGILTTAALAVGLAWAAGATTAEEKKVSGRLYELRTYTTHPGRLEALHQRFKNHTIKLFERRKAGAKHVDLRRIP
jgi:hypothetical protein